MPKQKYIARNLHILVIGAIGVVTSFSVGIHTAGDVQTVIPSEAESTRLPGDIDGDGLVTAEDAIRILDIAQGYDVASPAELLGDPNGDGELTTSDALQILHSLPR